MSFIRPELRAALWRWREVATGGAVVAFGLLWVLGARGFMAWLGLPVIGLGAALVYLGRVRGRFRTDGDGPGIVQVTEGSIAYFGPLTGGAVALAALERITLDGTGKPAHWTLREADGTMLHIPVTARGAEALLDAFAQLPGFRTEPALQALSRGTGAITPLWRRAPQDATRALPGD